MLTPALNSTSGQPRRFHGRNVTCRNESACSHSYALDFHALAGAVLVPRTYNAGSIDVFSTNLHN